MTEKYKLRLDEVKASRIELASAIHAACSASRTQFQARGCGVTAIGERIPGALRRKLIYKRYWMDAQPGGIEYDEALCGGEECTLSMLDTAQQQLIGADRPRKSA
ncbi:hypothetical protein [Paenibacillus sp. y28]|uniref:hypothetical protein n=1 Tax=Paenibacillus sp. y28 TaxID=3129110 RepID=UPI003015A51A